MSNKQTNKNALVVMARAVEVGKVKTRLIPTLGEEGACNLYKCLLEDLYKRITSLKGVDIFVFHTPSEVTDNLSLIVPDGILLLPQVGADLGERMNNAIIELLNRGYDGVTIIGSDSPDIPLKSISDSFLKLKGNTSFVLGPSTDGGYYLISSNSSSDAPFIGVDWGSSTVFQSTISNLKNAGIEYDLLGEWHDIDEEEDLSYLKDNLETPKSSNFLKNFYK